MILITFYDLCPEELDQDSQFFFNVLIVCIGISYSSDILPKNIIEYWSLDRLTTSQPVAFYICREDDIEGKEVIHEYYPHSVVEITTDNMVFWYDMVDYETEDFWKIEPIIEDFDYEEEDDE